MATTILPAEAAPSPTIGGGLAHVVCFGDQAVSLQFLDAASEPIMRHLAVLQDSAAAATRAAAMLADDENTTHFQLIAMLRGAEILSGLACAMRDECEKQGALS